MTRKHFFSAPRKIEFRLTEKPERQASNALGSLYSSTSYAADAAYVCRNGLSTTGSNLTVAEWIKSIAGANTSVSGSVYFIVLSFLHCAGAPETAGAPGSLLVAFVRHRRREEEDRKYGVH